MSLIRCEKIQEVLTDTLARFEWDDYVYIFTQTKDWVEPGANFVCEATENGNGFLSRFLELKIKYTWMQLNAMKSDLPLVFEVADYLHMPTDRKVVELMIPLGWKSGLVWATYGFGGAMGFLVLYSKKPKVPARLAESTRDHLFHWVPRLNAWSREEMARDAGSDGLSMRETQCMMLVADGKKSKEIAWLLDISQRTVEFHIQNAIHKLGGVSRSQAASRMSMLTVPQHLSMKAAANSDLAANPDPASDRESASAAE